LFTGFHFDAARAHVHHHVEEAIQQLQGKEVCTGRIWLPLKMVYTAVSEEEEPAGLAGAEVQGDGSSPLGVPLGQRQVRVGSVKGDWFKGLNTLTAELQITMDTDPWVLQLGQA
ncbi:hypothetical protein NQD34_010712, partial [Periophthalmus magnuspinnatus]